MSQLSDAIKYINGVYSGVNGVSVPLITENMTVSQYLSIINSLQVQALKLVDESISAVQAAGQFVNVSAQLSLLSGLRTQLVTLYSDINSFFNGTADNLTLTQAWDIKVPSPPPVNDVTPPVILPADDAVVLYGDTPMLLRASDPSVPIGATYSGPPSGLIVTSPEISYTSGQSGSIGTYTSAVSGEVLQTIKDSTVSGVKGLLGEFINSSGNQYAGYSFQAVEAYELGEVISNKANKSIDFITSGLEVIKGNKLLSEWNAEHNAFLGQTENEFNALATSTTTSKVPIVGWVLSPVVDAYMKMSYMLKNTNSFTISATLDSTVTGGSKGGIFLGGTQNDSIVVGNGNTLASGGGGNDTFNPGTGNQYLLGDSGIDTTLYTTVRSSHTLKKVGSDYTVSSLGNTQTLLNVERLQFSNTNIALDIDGNSGMVAKILGATLGSSAVHNKEYVGIGLYNLDSGMSYVALGALVMNALGKTSHSDAVDLLWNNVVGSPIGAADKSYFVGLLDNGMSIGELTALAADTSLNTDKIGLIGLSQTGIEYTPFG